MNLILPHSKIVRATYNPRSDMDYFAYLENSIGKEFDFREARPVGIERKFWPADKNFPSSAPVSEHDLIFKNDDTISTSK